MFVIVAHTKDGKSHAVEVDGIVSRAASARHSFMQRKGHLLPDDCYVTAVHMSQHKKTLKSWSCRTCKTFFRKCL